MNYSAVWVGGALLLFAATVAGCAVRAPKAQLTIPHNCITDVKLTDTTKCTYDEKRQVWTCGPLVIAKLPGCEVMEVQREQATKPPQAPVPHTESGVPKP